MLECPQTHDGVERAEAVRAQPESVEEVDVEAAKPFYPAVFGWTLESHEGEMTYHEFHLGSESVGGMLSMPPQVPAEVPSHWLAYFGVDEVDSSATRVKDLGGAVFAGPMDFPGGRFAVATDPQGAAFGLLRMA